MVQLNNAGEVADFVNESQFELGESAFECVAFSAALIKYAGEPGHGPTGTGEQIDQLADQWYSKEEGSAAVSNMNGMSLDAEYNMLGGMGLKFHALPISDSSQPADDLTNVKAWLRLGYPVMICGAEAGFFDLAMGDVVPYAWPPSGNHCIVACGIASDGNLLVRDTASIAPMGVRPGPRHYDAGRMHLVSGTAVEVSWLPSLPANFNPLAQEANPHMDTQAQDVWNMFLKGIGQQPLSYVTGIARSWQQNYLHLNAGSPLGPETSTVDWNGVAIQYQLFSGGVHAEYSTVDHKVRWYDAQNRQVA